MRFDRALAEQREHLLVRPLPHFDGMAEPLQDLVHDRTGHGVEARVDLAQHDPSVPIGLSPSPAADDRTYSGDQKRTTRECPRFDAGTSRRTFWAEAGWKGATVVHRRLVPVDG